MTDQLLVERAQELAELGALIDGLAAGSGGVALVRGPAGIGKTALLRASTRLAAAAGVKVLGARGVELERSWSFGVTRRLFERHLLGLDDETRRAVLGGAAALALHVVDPPSAVTAAPPEEAGFSVLHGLYWLAANLAAQQAMVVVVDDLQWVDPQSLRWLTYLAEHLEDLPILLLMGVRTGEGGDDDVVRSVGERRDTVAVLPRPLSMTAVTILAREVLGFADDVLAEACYDVTSGNPFLVSELLRSLRDSSDASVSIDPGLVRSLTPEAITRAFLPRLGRLGSGAVAVASATAILGSGASWPAVASVAGQDSDDMAAAVDVLADADILRIDDRATIAFVHPLLRRAVEGDLAAGVRTQMHARAALALEREGARASDIAAHLVRGAPAGRAATAATLRTAAVDMIAVGDPLGASRMLRRALAEPPTPEHRPELLLKLGTAEHLAALPEAAEHLQAALETATDPHLVVEAALILGRVKTFLGQLSSAREVLDSTADRLGPTSPALAHKLKVAALSSAWMELNAQPSATMRLDAIVQSISGGGSPADRQLDLIRGYRLATGGSPADEVSQLIERSGGTGELLAVEGPESFTFQAGAQALCFIEHFAEAERWLEAGLDAARRTGSVVAYSVSCCFRAGFIALPLGDLVRAEEDARRSLEISIEQRWHAGVPMAVAYLAEALVAQGRIAEAAGVIARSPLDHLPPIIMFQPLVRAHGLIQAAQGNTDAAIGHLTQFGQTVTAFEVLSPAALEWRSTTAQLLASRGRHDEAIELADQDVAYARRAGTPRALGIAMRARALSHPGGPDPDELAAAADLLASTPGRVEHAKSLVELGACLRRRGRRADARSPLAQGYETATRAGANTLAERARVELVASGARPRRPLMHGRDALTGSEQRTAEMAATGLSNTEIAQALFVTRKTVEKHLGNAYLKLAISGRDELPRALNATQR